MGINLKERSKFTVAFALSCALHTFLIFALFVKLPGGSSNLLAHQVPKKIVKAVAIKQDDVEREMSRIENQKRMEEQRRRDEISRYKRQVAQAKKHRQQIEKSVHQLSEKEKRINKHIKAAKLMAQKSEREAAAKQQQLAKLAHEQQALQERIKKHQAQVLAEKKRLEQEKLKQKKQQLDKLAKKRQKELNDALEKQLSSEQAQLAKMHAQQMTLEIARYKAKIVSSVSRNWLIPKNADKKLTCQMLIHLGPGGVVLDVSTIKSSGDAVLDRSAKTAILKASPLPVPAKPELFEQFRELRLTVRPEGIRAT